MTDWNKLISEYRDLEKQSFEEYCSHSWNYANISGWEIKKFATKLKEVCSLLTGIPVEDFEKEEIKSSYLGEEWNWGGQGHGPTYTVRQLLQYVGTNAMRDVIHPNVWVNALFSKYYPKICSGVTYCALAGKPEISCNQCPEYPNWLISDVRFPNEAKAIKDRQGIVIRINRNKPFIETTQIVNKLSNGERYSKNQSIVGQEEITIREHTSETALDNYSFDYVIENDSDIPSLIEKVKEMLIYFKLL